MNKDAIMATAIGFGIGLVITGAILFGPNALKMLPSSFTLPSLSQRTKPTTSPGEPTPPASRAFTVDSPLVDAIVDSDTILVSGPAPAGSIIVVQGHKGEEASRASAEGKFAGKVALVEGKNDIIVTSYNNKDEQNKTVTVYYTQES